MRQREGSQEWYFMIFYVVLPYKAWCWNTSPLKLGEICSAIEGSNMRFNYDVHQRTSTCSACLEASTNRGSLRDLIFTYCNNLTCFARGCSFGWFGPLWNVPLLSTFAESILALGLGLGSCTASPLAVAFSETKSHSWWNINTLCISHHFSSFFSSTCWNNGSILPSGYD